MDMNVVLRVLICVRRCSLYMDIPGLSLLLHFQICTWTICAYAGLYQRQRDRDREIYGRDRGIVREKETEDRVRIDKPFCFGEVVGAYEHRLCAYYTRV